MSYLSEPILGMIKILKGVAGEKVTYTEYGGGSYTVTAILARYEAITETIDSVFTDRTGLDFIIRSDEMQNLPARGDSITKSNGKVYVILSIGSEPQWRYIDQEEVAVRIHTKERE